MATIEEQKQEEENYKMLAKEGTELEEKNILNQSMDNIEDLASWQQENENINYPKIIDAPLDPTLSEIDRIREQIKDLSTKITEFQTEIDINECKILSMKNDAINERKRIFEKFYKNAKLLLLNSKLIREVCELVITLELQSKSQKINDLGKKIDKILNDLAENIEKIVFFTKTPATINGYTSNVPEIFLKWDYIIFDLNSFSDYLQSFLILALIHEVMHYIRRILAKEHEEIEIKTPKLTEQMSLIECGFECEQEKIEFLKEEAGGRAEILLFGHQLKEIYEIELETFLDFATNKLDFKAFRKTFKENRKYAVSANKKSIACRTGSGNGFLERGSCALACMRNLN